MKKLLIIFALCLGTIGMATAQTASSESEPTSEDYERLIENYYNVKFREMAFDAMELNEDEIVKIDPLYSEYVARKKELVQKRNKLVDEYREELSEEGDADEYDDDTADFIENYWETQIAEMELRKDYFDRFEDIVSTEKAIQFFLLEEKSQSRVEEVNLIQIVPMMMDVREYEYSPEYKEYREQYHYKQNKSYNNKDKDSSMTWDEDDVESVTDENKSDWAKTTTKDTDKDWSNKDGHDKMNHDKKAYTATGDKVATSETNACTTYSNWVNDNNDKVGLDHQYTHDGLMKLVSAIWMVGKSHGIDVSDWADEKQQIKNVADKLQKDPTSDEHADIAREAFVMAADMISAVQEKNGSESTEEMVAQVKTAATAIDPDTLMTPQAKHIYEFFRTADQALSALSKSAKMKNTSASSSNDE